MSPFLFTLQLNQTHQKFMKDGGRTRRWCKGALFQVSLKQHAALWSVNLSHWTPPPHPCIHSKHSVLDLEVATYYIFKIASTHLAVGKSFIFSFWQDLFVLPTQLTLFHMIDWQQIPLPPTFSILCLCVRLMNFWDAWLFSEMRGSW